MQQEMTAKDVVDIYSQLNDNKIDAWIDGGWGIDALIGELTRPHGDLDIIIQEKDVTQIKELLGDQNYKILQRDDLADNYFHMSDGKGHEIDITAIHFDEKGDGIFGPAENNEMNPADSFGGIGKINGQEVKCVSLEYAIKFRLDHEIAKHDAEDIIALCKKFGLEIPVEYREP